MFHSTETAHFLNRPQHARAVFRFLPLILLSVNFVNFFLKSSESLALERPGEVLYAPSKAVPTDSVANWKMLKS